MPAGKRNLKGPSVQVLVEVIRAILAENDVAMPIPPRFT
jgi:hypothetical protein